MKKIIFMVLLLLFPGVVVARTLIVSKTIGGHPQRLKGGEIILSTITIFIKAK